MNNAILLSGGMDSIALAYWKRPAIAVTIDYGQLAAKKEIATSRIVADQLDIQHHVIEVDCKSLGSGDLLNQQSLQVSPSTEWWPFRNQLLVTLALMKVIKLGVTELMVASVSSDGFHKDGTHGFYELLTALSSYQEGGIVVKAPAIGMTTAELIKTSGIPRDLLLWAHSCHKSNVACGNCRGCLKYRLVMSEIFYAE